MTFSWGRGVYRSSNRWWNNLLTSKVCWSFCYPFNSNYLTFKQKCLACLNIFKTHSDSLYTIRIILICIQKIDRIHWSIFIFVLYHSSDYSNIVIWRPSNICIILNFSRLKDLILHVHELVIELWKISIPMIVVLKRINKFDMRIVS